jgi:hypothetical protein
MLDLAAPLRGLVVGLAGAGMAWLCFNGLWWAAVLITAAGITIGWLLDWLGATLLPKKPVAAVRVLEWWLVVPATIAAAAGAAVIIITVALAVPDSTPDDTKEIVAALSSGITAFITTAFISWAGDEKDSSLGDHVRDVFQAKYKPEVPPAERDASLAYFAPESRGLRLVYSEAFAGVEGWGRSARRKRAEELAKVLPAP